MIVYDLYYRHSIILLTLRFLTHLDPIPEPGLDRLATVSRLRNCANVINEPHGRAGLQTIASLPSLGNPLAFAIIHLLAENKDMTPSQIARGVGRSISRVSHVLGSLRMTEVVRYETNGKLAKYRLKHPREVRQILSALGNFIDSSAPS